MKVGLKQIEVLGDPTTLTNPRLSINGAGVGIWAEGVDTNFATTNLNLTGNRLHNTDLNSLEFYAAPTTGTYRFGYLFDTETSTNVPTWKVQNSTLNGFSRIKALANERITIQNSINDNTNNAYLKITAINTSVFTPQVSFGVSAQDYKSFLQTTAGYAQITLQNENITNNNRTELNLLNNGITNISRLAAYNSVSSTGSKIEIFPNQIWIIPDRNNVSTINTDKGAGFFGVYTTYACILAHGTTAERPPLPVAGMERYNTTDNKKEYYNGTTWIQI